MDSSTSAALVSTRHLLITLRSCVFSIAAATRSLSFICRFSEPSLLCEPGVMRILLLIRRGRHVRNLWRMHRPMTAACLMGSVW